MASTIPALASKWISRRSTREGGGEKQIKNGEAIGEGGEKQNKRETRRMRERERERERDEKMEHVIAKRGRNDENRYRRPKQKNNKNKIDKRCKNGTNLGRKNRTEKENKYETIDERHFSTVMSHLFVVDRPQWITTKN